MRERPTDALDVYRKRPCAQCVELQVEIARLKERLRGERALHPWQQMKDSACVFCGGRLFRDAPNQPGFYYKKSEDDERACEGRRWWRRSCPIGPHLHRYCDWCGGRWLEEPKRKP